MVAESAGEPARRPDRFEEFLASEASDDGAGLRGKEVAMKCVRCRGLMVRDQFYDMLDDSGHFSFRGWRCVCCGNILDPLILKNKRVRSSAMAHA